MCIYIHIIFGNWQMTFNGKLVGQTKPVVCLVVVGNYLANNIYPSFLLSSECPNTHHLKKVQLELRPDSPDLNFLLDSGITHL